MCVCAIGYTYRQFEDTVADLTDVHNSMVAGNLVEIAVAAPYSVHWGRRDFIATQTPPRPTAEPGFDLDPDLGYASGAWGLARWEFDKTLWLPRNSTLQLDLSPAAVPNLAGLPNLPDEELVSSIVFDEVQTGIFGGNNRLAERTQRLWAQGNRLAELGLPAADAFGALALGGQGDAVTWPASGQFQNRIFNRQETNRGQDKNAYAAFAVMVDQISYDDAIQVVAAPISGSPLAPITTRMVARARCANGGTNEWWWRPGAPLCLVAPTITPALVYDLPEPIVLGPGEQLELEVQVPPGVLITPAVGSSIPSLFQPTYQIGISFTGYASIEM
jgi:hypothetical protein